MTDAEIEQLWEKSEGEYPNFGKIHAFARRILNEAAESAEPVAIVNAVQFAPKHHVSVKVIEGQERSLSLHRLLYLHPAEPCVKDSATDAQIIAVFKASAEAAEAKCTELRNQLAKSLEWKMELDCARDRLSTLRNEVLEEAAKVCDKRESELRYYRCDGATEMEEVAERIRNLKTKGETK